MIADAAAAHGKPEKFREVSASWSPDERRHGSPAEFVRALAAPGLPGSS